MSEKNQDELEAELHALRLRISELELLTGQGAGEGGECPPAAPSSGEDEGAGKGTEKKRTENARMTVSKGKEIGQDEGHLGGEFKIQENPAFLAKRMEVYEKLKARRAEEAASYPREPIKVTLPDGTVLEKTSFETSPMDIALGISKGLANSVIVAKVFYSRRVGKVLDIADSSGFDEDEEEKVDQGELWDLTRPLEGDCKLELLKFDDREAKMVFWHSSAHVLGECVECQLGSHLTVGPPIDPGFYYDTYLGNQSLDDKGRKKLEEKAKKVIKEKQEFERIVLTKEEALELFAENPFKLSIIRNKIKDGELTTAYRCGPLIDLCMGPHVVNTGKIKTFEVTKSSTSYWLGSVDNDPLHRIYGISFPDKKMMKLHKEFMAKAAENDHRKRAVEQKLFFFHPFSPGSAFFLPHGARIYTTLLKFIRNEYWKRGYQEVVTPNIYNAKLWQQSGHWKHYKDDMFSFLDSDKNVFGLKPMNCPGHCLMFGHQRRSYRDLPWRVADFGVLHRNEASGALSGLTRVRRFQQDDAHIFCAMEDLEKEILGALDFMKYVYGTFGMTYQIKRSTRPKKAVGLTKEDGSPDPEGIAKWDRAEEILANVLDKFVGVGKWRDNPGDGAFYGPKLDTTVFDCFGRAFQCATIQLDFQMPERFELQFQDKGENISRPVMIHRAMLGSLERMIAVLTEHFQGKWPFWLSPRQATIFPIHEDFNDYVLEVQEKIRAAGFHCDSDLSSNTLKKKVRTSQVEQHNFILVVGPKEKESGSVDVRCRVEVGQKEGTRIGIMKVEELLDMFKHLEETRALYNGPKPAEEESEEGAAAAADADAEA